MRVSVEAGNVRDYEPPPDLNPAELGEENEKEKRLTRFTTLSKKEILSHFETVKFTGKVDVIRPQSDLAS